MCKSSPSSRVQPSRLTVTVPGLNSSIHSSLEEASVPDQATSLIRRVPGGSGGMVGGWVNVSVAVGVAEGVTLSAGGVSEKPGVRSGEEVDVGSMLDAADAVGVVVGKEVSVKVAEGDRLAMGEEGVPEIKRAVEAGVDGVSDGRLSVMVDMFVRLVLAVTCGGSMGGALVGGTIIKTINPTARTIMVDRREGSAWCIAFPLGNQSRSILKRI